MNIQVDPTSSNLASAILNSKIRPRVIVGCGVETFHPGAPNCVTRSPGKEEYLISAVSLVKKPDSASAILHLGFEMGISKLVVTLYLDSHVEINSVAS